MFWLGVLCGFVIGGIGGFLVCAALSMSRIADLEQIIDHLLRGSP